MEETPYYLGKCTDRRRYQRLNRSFNVSYKIDSPVDARVAFGNREIEAVTLDIGEGGIAILTDQDIPPWTILSMKFRLIRMSREGQVNYSEPVQMCGEVRSNNIFEQRQHRLGICFVEKEPEVTNRIGDFVIKTVEL